MMAGAVALTEAKHAPLLPNVEYITAALKGKAGSLP
jgi:hypothetical protein